MRSCSILDEPCEGLDLGAREKFLGGLSRLAEAKLVTMVYVTHRTDEIPPGFTHAMLLKDGRVLAAGRIERTLTAENLSACFEPAGAPREARGQVLYARRPRLHQCPFIRIGVGRS